MLRAGTTQGVLRDAVLALSTWGIFLRSFTMGHLRQPDAVRRQMLRRDWEGGQGPGEKALTIDICSTLCEAFGLLKQGVGFGYTRVRGYHPLLATRAHTGEGLQSWLLGGSAFAAPGSRWVPGRDLLPGAPWWGHRPADPAGGLRLLLHGGAHHLPRGRGAVLGHRAPGQGGPSGDSGHPGGGVGADPLLVERGHLRLGRAGAAHLRC